ncbi:hypothetical protein BD410DRAFT_790861, partial [Rickenella mellea]
FQMLWNVTVLDNGNYTIQDAWRKQVVHMLASNVLLKKTKLWSSNLGSSGVDKSHYGERLLVP